MITREEWLYKCVDIINDYIFDGEFDIQNIKFQIACGWCKSQKALGETIFPYDGEDITLDDCFPITIHISVKEDDECKIIGILTHEMIHAFANIRNHGKDFKKIAKRIGFQEKITELHINDELSDKIKCVKNIMHDKYGEFPGKAINLHLRKKKEHNKNIFKLYCPQCGFNVKAKKTDVDKFGRPSCACGTLMTLDIEEHEDNES